MLLEILSIIAPVFVCAAIGYTWVKTGHDFDTGFISKLVINIGAPCLIFSTFMSIEIERQAFTTMIGASLLTTVIFAVIGYGVLRLCKLSQQAFLPTQILPNVGNMGLPLCLLAFGDEGLALGLTYFTANTIIGFIGGMTVASGQLSLRELFRNPILYAVIITVSMVFTDTKAPEWIFNTTELLGGLVIPLMLIALGVSLARFRITSLQRSLGLAVLRLGMGFITGVVCARLLGFEGAARGVLILQCSMPAAVFSYLFAVRYNRQPEEVAATVVISTVLSFLSLPVLLWYVL